MYMYVHIYNLICMYRRVCVHIVCAYTCTSTIISIKPKYTSPTNTAPPILINTHTYVYVCINECAIIYMSTNIPIKPE